MAITCTTENLMSLSECFLCLTAEQRDAIKTYLLAVIAGGSTDPETLMASAACFTCLTPKQLKTLQPYLMCLIANAAAPAGDCENVEGAGEPGAATPDFIGQVYTDTAIGNIWRANSTTPGDWTLEVVAKQFVFTGDTLSNAWLLMEGSINPPADITEIHLPGLVTIGADLTIQDSSGLLVVDMSSVTSIDPGGHLSIETHSALQSVDLSSLTTLVASGATGGWVTVSANPLLTSYNIAALQTIGENCEFDCDSNTSLASLSLPVLSSLGVFSYNSITDTAIASLDLSSITSIAANATLLVSSNPSLTSLDISNAVIGGVVTLDFRANALDAASVNAALATCVASPLFTGGGFIKLEGGTNAAPSGQGIADAATMTGRGVTVTTN